MSQNLRPQLVRWLTVTQWVVAVGLLVALAFYHDWGGMAVLLLIVFGFVLTARIKSAVGQAKPDHMAESADSVLQAPGQDCSGDEPGPEADRPRK